MKALLLAAGLGTRLYPITASVPKCLVPIYGRPLLDWWLQMLVEGGVSPLLVNLHYKSEEVIKYLAGSRFGNHVSTVYEERLVGTAGTLLKNRDFFDRGPLMLIHADNLSLFDVSEFIKRHADRPPWCEITMMTFQTDTPETCGILELDEHGVVSGFHEKVRNPPGTLANGAVYIVEATIFEFLMGLNKEVIDFSTEVLPHYLGKIFTFQNETYHRDIGTVESYEKALDEIKFCINDREPLQ